MNYHRFLELSYMYISLRTDCIVITVALLLRLHLFLRKCFIKGFGYKIKQLQRYTSCASYRTTQSRTSFSLLGVNNSVARGTSLGELVGGVRWFIVNKYFERQQHANAYPLANDS